MELLCVLLALAGTGAVTGLAPPELPLCRHRCSQTLAQAGVQQLPMALLPYVPRVPPTPLPGKLTATTFTLERPRGIFTPLASASDTVWLVVALANASDSFRNPPSRDAVPPYEQLPTAHAYMTLEAAVATYACSAPSPAVLRVGGDTACGGQSGRHPCNGPLPSPGPYRVKFLVMGCHGPKAETRWSDPILLRRAGSPSTIDPRPGHRGSDTVVMATLLASLGAALVMAAISTMGAQVWGSLCCRDSGSSIFTCSSYRTHHIPPALPRTLPPGCRCSPPGLGCFVPQPPAPCPAE